jgi:uncharacterized protein (TIGR03437 family)
MKTRPNSTTIGILALIFPIAAVAANLTGTQTLNSGQAFSFDTGTVVSSGGDILQGSSGITLQGSATALTGAMFFQSGMADYNSLVALGPAGLAAFSSAFNGQPIPSSALTVNAIFAVKTVGGNAAAFIITASSSSSITFQYTSFIAAAAGPTITQVINNYGLIPSGFTNSGISPGTLFIIKGSGLASATSVTTLQSTTGGSTLPTTLNGATVKVTVGSVSVTPAFYYAENVQLALVLPSNTPLGASSVTVTYNGQTSAPASIQVVASAFGFAASSGAGSGAAHVQDLNYEYYSYANSIPPGATVRLIGSGLGADPTRDGQYVQPTASSAINSLAHIYVGGVDAAIFYQGPEGYPGVDEVDVTIPANAPTGCNVPLVGVDASGVPTNFLSLAIGNGVCKDPGLGGTTLTPPIGQTKFSFGYVELLQIVSPATSGSGTQITQTASAGFRTLSGVTTDPTTGTSSSSAGGSLSIGGCIVAQTATGTGTTGTPTSTITTTGLDAGTITVTGPNGSVPLTSLASLFPNSASLVGLYSTENAAGTSTLPTGFIPESGGAFMFQGTGGTTASSVGPFTTQLVLPNPLFQFTNQAQDTTVARSAGLPVTWIGGSPGSYVVIAGVSLSGKTYGGFTCIAPVSALQFTVPPYVLAALPAGTGSLIVENETIPQPFTATGLDFAYSIGLVAYDIGVTYK